MERAVGAVVAARRTRASLVGGHLDGVLFQLDAGQLSLGVAASACLDDLRA